MLQQVQCSSGIGKYIHHYCSDLNHYMATRSNNLMHALGKTQAYSSLRFLFTKRST